MQNKKILLVDDDEALRKTLEAILLESGFQVTTAVDGASAQGILSLEPFDLIVSDIRMPNLSGIELLRVVKQTKATPVILMTGFSEILQAKEAHELGAFGFLAKPFKKPEFVSLVKSALEISDPPVELIEDLDDQYTGLRVDDFLTGKEIMFDIFVRLSASKYIKVATGGESISIERITTFKGKGLTHLYLRREDFRKYLGFAVNVVSKVAASRSIDSSRKVKLFTQTTSTLIKSLYLDDLSKDRFEAASEMVLNAVSLACEDADLLHLMEAIKNQSDHLHRHSLAVSTYSVLIAKASAWTSPRTIMLAAMAGILHDIGMKELPKELVEKPRFLMGAEEIRLYETHPGRGLELVSRIKSVPEDVAVVVAQHHEDCLGTGYPLHLSKNKVSPLARLVALADAFCEYAFQGPGYEGMKASEAITRLSSVSPERYDGEFLKNLSSLFSGKHASAKAAGTKKI